MQRKAPKMRFILILSIFLFTHIYFHEDI